MLFDVEKEEWEGKYTQEKYVDSIMNFPMFHIERWEKLTQSTKETWSGEKVGRHKHLEKAGVK